MAGESLSSKDDAVQLKSGFSFQRDNTSDAGNRTPPAHIVFLDSSITLPLAIAHIMLNAAVR